MKEYPKIIFLNQRSGTFFQELAKDIAHQWHPSEIWTEVIGDFKAEDCLTLKRSPGYSRKNSLTRLFSWSAYFFYVAFKLLFSSSRSLLFIVPMPPFLGLLGYLFKKLRGQKYVILVFDIHPDLLIQFGGLKNKWIICMWRKMNAVVLANAEAVMTIGDFLAENLQRQYDVSSTALGHVAVMPVWADVEWLKPIAKDQNPFVGEHRLKDKFVVMYSGNIGATHDIETLMEAVKRLRDYSEMQFVIIGDGAKKQYVLDFQNKFDLANLLVLPYVPQEYLPYSLSAADVAVITQEPAAEGLMIPSRIFSSLAAGNAVIAVCGQNCELAEIVRQNQCGSVVQPEDVDALTDTIVQYHNDSTLLNQKQINSRNTAVQNYSRKNAKLYVELLKKSNLSQLYKKNRFCN